MSVLKSIYLIKFRVLTHRMQCLNVAVIAYITMLLELNDINNNVIERVTGFVSVRTATDVLLYLALDT